MGLLFIMSNKTQRWQPQEQHSANFQVPSANRQGFIGHSIFGIVW